MKVKAMAKKTESELQAQLKFLTSLVGKIKEGQVQQAVQMIKDEYMSSDESMVTEETSWVSFLTND